MSLESQIWPGRVPAGPFSASSPVTGCLTLGLLSHEPILVQHICEAAGGGSGLSGTASPSPGYCELGSFSQLEGLGCYEPLRRGIGLRVA